MKQGIKKMHKKYEHLIMPLALVGGFILDIFTLNRIDQIFDNAILIAHIVIVTITISLLFSQGTHFGIKFLHEKRIRILQTIMVFSFGALFSGFVIFYTRSGSLLTSWPFILAILVLMLGTEFRKKYFHKLVLQIGIFYVAIISWLTFFIPVLIKKMGPWIFVASTLVSVLLMGLFLMLLKKINQQKLLVYKKPLVVRIISIILLFNILYFTNIIPPIPLSLKFKAVYYDVDTIDTGYRAQYEKTAWWDFLNKRSRDMYWREGEDIYVFTQVFAPTDLTTNIQHIWEEYDEGKRRWKSNDTITLKITGGRKDGYRGFSKKTNLSYGTWRVKSATSQGQTLGIITFDVVPYGKKVRELVIEEL